MISGQTKGCLNNRKSSKGRRKLEFTIEMAGIRMKTENTGSSLRPTVRCCKTGNKEGKRKSFLDSVSMWKLVMPTNVEAIIKR